MNSKCPKILIVDDIPDWCLTLKGLIDDIGEIYTARSYDEAVSILNKEHIDLVVIDICLDENDDDNHDGLKLISMIRLRWQQIKRIVITGYDSVELVVQALEPHQGESLASAFIAKNDMSGFVQTVTEFLS